MHKYMPIVLLLLAVPAFGQLPGDLNCDGDAYSVGDLVWFIDFMSNCDDENVDSCAAENGDLDADGQLLTVADFLILLGNLGGPFEPTYYPTHPESDTFRLGSIVASPGQHVAIPIHLSTIDTISGVQFCVTADTNYVTIDSLSATQGFPFFWSNCFGYLHDYSFDFANPRNPVFLVPANYDLADLFVTVRNDIDEIVTTPIEFTEYAPHAYYTGVANLTFFQPVLVNGEITILPTGIDDPDEPLPRAASLTAYPNPFNSNINLSLTSQSPGELVIYDLAGRSVRSFPVSGGRTIVNWDGTDAAGNDIAAGVYFVRLRDSKTSEVVKILYVK